jgi:hypothetical protein
MKKEVLVSFMFLIAMISTAAAYTPGVWDEATNSPANTLKLEPGESVTLSYRMENIGTEEYGQVLPYTASVKVVTGDGADTDIEIVTPETITVPYDSTYTDVDAITISMNTDAPKGTVYRISIGAGGTTMESELEVKSEIPEFPTIVLPIAAILGLAFFMQRRKEE